MTRTHKITRRIMALVLCAVLVLTSGGTGLGSILTSELWSSLFPAAEAATIEVNSWSSLDSAIVTANSAGTGTQTTIKLSGNISDNNDGAGVSARTAITGNILLDLNGYSITDIYYGTESGKNDNSTYQLPTNNAGNSVEVDTLTNAVFTVNEGATLQIYNSSSTASTVSISSRVIRTEKPGSRKTIRASANLINCKGTLILGDTNGTKTNFTLHADATAYNEDVGGSYGQYAFSAAMTISLLSAKAIFKMYGGTVTSAALSRCTKAMPAGARSYSLNIDNCMSADIYGGTISVIKNTKYYSDKNENFDSGIYNADGSTSMSENYNSYFIAIRCNAGKVFIFDVASSVYSYAGRLTWSNGFFGAGAGGASLHNANIWVNSATVYLMGGTFENTSNVSDDNAAKHYPYFHYGNVVYPQYATDDTPSWATEGTQNAQAVTYFTIFYAADKYTENALWYGNYNSVSEWIDAGFDYTYDAHTARKKTGTWNVAQDAVAGTNLPLNKYKRTAYEQSGWTAVFAGTNTEVANVVSGISPDTFGGTGGTVFVHPTWTPSTYTVTYLWDKADNITLTDENGILYQNGPVGKNYNIESADRFLLTPTRPGYDFAGWRPVDTAGKFPSGKIAWNTENLYAGGMSLKGQWDNVSLRPEWTPKPYTITFVTDKNADGTYSFNSTAELLDPNDPNKVVSANAYKDYNLDIGGTLPSVRKPGYLFQNSWKIVDLKNGGGAAVGNNLPVGAFGSIWGNMTLQANLTPIDYTVTYSIPDDAKLIGTELEKNVTFDAAYGELAKAERDGYTFLGWTTVAGSNTPNVDSKTIYTTVGDTTLYACWSAIGYEVRLYYYNSENQKTPLNDGNAITVDFDAPYGDQLNKLQPDDSVRAGWEFVRWYDENGNTVTKDTIYKTAANSVLYADLKEATYYMTFDENGGSSVADFSYKISDTFTLPTSTKTGYELRWKARNTAGKWVEGVLYAPGTFTPGEYYGTVDFIAEWTLASYKLTLDANGGACSVGEINYNYESAVSAADFASKYTPTRAGYIFDGWFVKESVGSWNEGEKVTSLAAANHGNVTLVAKWTAEEYTLTFDLDGGEYNGEKEYSVTYTIEDEISMFAPDKTAYTFHQWVVAEGINIGAVWSAGTYIQATDILREKYGNVTLVAQWTPINYIISFHADGGTEEWTYSTYNTNQAYSLPNSTKPGYIFKGWLPDADAGSWVRNEDSPYAAGTSVSGQYGDVSFTAQWKTEDFTATLEPNGGTLAETAVGYNIQTGADLPTPVREGYSFNGWLVKESVGSWVKNDENAITHIATGNYGNVTLVADWKVIEYDATFYSQNTLQTALTVNDYTVEGTIELKKLERDYHTFQGWRPKESVGSWKSTELYQPGIYEKAWGTVEFVAEWDIYKYTIIWENYDGSVLEKDTDVEHGTQHTYDGLAPTKAADDQYTYTFIGWELAESSEANTYVYVAKFAQTVRSYTVTWQYETDEDASTPLAVITETVVYGEMPVFKGGIPVKESVDSSKHVWQFMGWTPAVSPVTGNVTYTAIFEENNNPITITWHIGGEAHKTYGVTGASPVYPTTPVLEKNDGYNYSFVGWAVAENGTVLDTLPALGTENVDYYAIFTRSAVTYNATLIGNGGTVERENETYAVEGDALELPVPVRNGYTFTGWKPLNNAGNWDANTIYSAGVLGGMIGNVTLVAQWKAAEYTVTVYPADGSAEYDIIYTIDGTQTLPTITREGYTFTGWYVLLGEGSWNQGQVLDMNASLTNSYGNLTVQAQWQVNRYTVTWIIDGTFATETYAYGAAIAQRTVPEKLGYTAAWDIGTVPQVMPAANITITAVYTLREYTISYNANGGEMPAGYPTVYNITSTDALPVPTKAGSLFAGWQVVNEGGNWILNTTTASSATLAGRYGNVSLKAVWTPIIHEIKWVIDGKDRISHWYYGAMPSYDGIPVKPADAENTYTFIGWDKEIVTVTGDAVYTAQFDSVKRKYSVTWMLDDKVLEVQEYVYGETPDYPGTDPIKPANSLYAYTFAGWSPEITAVEGPQTYYAQFTVYRFVQQVVLDYSNITLVNGNTLQLTVSVYPFEADDPSVEWFSLDESIATVDSNGFVTAVGVGSTSICVRSLENPELVAFCTVRVTPIFVTWLEITASSTTTLGIGEAVQLGYVLRPDNATNIAVNWVSMDAKVAIVGKTGLVTIVGEGTTKIYCYSADGYCAASISVTGLPETTTEDEEEEKYVIVWFPMSEAGGGYIIDGKTFEENTIKIPYGSDLSFQLVNNKGYVVKVNGSGAYYPDENGYYTVRNVTEDISILVFTSGDNMLDDEITNDPNASKSFFEKLGEFFRKIVLWFRSLFGMN